MEKTAWPFDRGAMGPPLSWTSTEVALSIHYNSRPMNIDPVVFNISSAIRAYEYEVSLLSLQCTRYFTYLVRFIVSISIH